MPFLAPHNRSVAAPSGIIRNGLTARWPMDEGSGTDVEDDTGNGHDGVTDDTTWVSGIGIGPWSLQFDSSLNSFVTVGVFVPAVTNALSICTRIQASNLVQGAIIDNGNSAGNRIFRFSILSATQMHVLIGDSGGGWGLVWAADIAVPIDTICHLGFTWDGATVRVYLNGVEQDSTSYAGTMTQSGTEACRLGNLSNPTSVWGLDGILDDARVYERQLSQSEMQQISDGTG